MFEFQASLQNINTRSFVFVMCVLPESPSWTTQFVFVCVFLSILPETTLNTFY